MVYVFCVRSLPIPRALVLSSVLAVLAGCGSGEGVDGGGVDGAPHDAAPRDGASSTDGAVDGGAIDAALVDGGGGFDAGTDSGPPDAGRACAEPVGELPVEYVPRCTAATRACVAACADAACRAACAAADTTAPYMGIARVDCAFCLQYEELRCTDMMGCSMQTAALQCCVADHCPDGGCIDTTCASEHAAYSSCESAMAPTCATAQATGDFAVCFAP